MEMMLEVRASLVDHALVLGLGAVFLLVLVWAERRRERFTPRVRRGLFIAGLSLAVAGGWALAARVLWLCDDAYITFRYSQNFAQGHGLVFNPGEWVEGYTNFLWALFLGVVGRFGGSIPLVALFGNLLSFALALWCVALLVRRATPFESSARFVDTRPLFPLAAMALGASVPFTTFASSGLETMPAAALVLCGVMLSFPTRRPVASGFVLSLATLTRPDHVLFGVALGAAFVVEDLLWRRGPWKARIPWRDGMRFAAPFVVLLVPYWLWRWHAYGDFYPNTYYAKSGGETYVEQGLTYAFHFFVTTGAWLLLPAFLLSFAFKARSRAESRLKWFALLSALLVVRYVVRVGGDFMQYRFFITLFAVLCAATEVQIRAIRLELRHPVSSRALTALALLSALAVAAPVRIIKPYEKRWHLAAEETFYPVKTVFPLTLDTGLYFWGQTLARTFPDGGLKPKLAHGCVGMIAYYSHLPIFDTYGLTSRRVAHRPITVRGRPGHEKTAVFDDYFEENAVLMDVAHWGPWSSRTAVTLPGVTLYFVRWDQATADVIRAAGGTVPDLDGDIARAAEAASVREAMGALEFYRKFLAKDPRATERLRTLERRVEELIHPPPGTAMDPAEALRVAEFLATGEARPSFDGLVRYTMDDAAWPSGVVVTGDAFGLPTERELELQQPVTGKQGERFADSYHGQDGPKGRLEFTVPAPTANATLDIGALVAGSADCAHLYFTARVNGVEREHFCGKQDETLRPISFQVEVAAGDRVDLVAVDDSDGAWGHLLLDDVQVRSRPR